MLSCIHIFEIALGVTIAQGFMLPIESLTAAAVYAYNRDWRHAAYWVSSACIILSVTL